MNERGCFTRETPSRYSIDSFSVSRILFSRRAGSSIIYLDRSSLAGSSGLPLPVPDSARIKTGSFDGMTPPGIYLALQPIRFTHAACHHAAS